MRVLTLVGTDHHPFHRLVRWVDGWSARCGSVECTIQYGTSEPPRHAKGLAYLEHDGLDRLMRKADVVVCHGGPSTILEARRHGHRPIVVPRLARCGEHVDNHQRSFTSRLAGSGVVLAAGAEDELAALLDRALEDPRLVRLEQMVEPDDNDEAVRRFGALVSDLFTP